MNGVIYARFSSDHQREESIEGQIRVCKEYAQKQGITVLKEYCDRAISGKTDKRPSFQQMIKDSDSRLFQIVIVYSLDRFARNGKQSAIYENMLNLNGVQLHSATENITGSPSSIILKSMLQGMAEYYSVELAQKITRGMTENALKGLWTSGTTPFGYIINKDRHLEPHPINATYLQRIFDMVLRGDKFIDIARYLNEQGVRTASGSQFNKGSFHRMLRNRVYIGEFKWNDVVKENAIPPLVTPETFYKVQKVLEMRSKVISRPSATYHLSSKAFCAHCDAPLQGMSGTSKSKGERHHYYVCVNKRRHKTCSLPNIPKEALEKVILYHLSKILTDQKNVQDIAKYAISAQNAAEENTELLRLKQIKKELQKKIDNCLKAIEDGIMSEALVQRLKESEASLEKIKLEITEQSFSLQASLLSEAQIIFFLNKIAQDIETDAAAAFRALVRQVFVEYKTDSDEYIITARFNYCNTESLHSLEEFRVRIISPMVEIERVNTNFIHFTKFYFECSFVLPRRSQRPAI